MITNRTLWHSLMVAVLAAVVACAQSDFAGNAAAKKEEKKGGKDAKDGNDTNDTDQGQDAKDAPDAGDTDSGKGDSDGDDELGNAQTDGDGDGTKDGELIEDDETLLKPQQCTTATIKYASGTANCPKNYAAYAIDDGKTASLACCPLPVKDILLKQDGVPKNTCATDEIATGTAGQLLVCSKINTKKYKLGPFQETCYVGSGHSGSSGVGECGAPNATLLAMASAFGSDACLGQPFGALVTSYNSKYCKDMLSAQLFYAKDNQPVPMHLP